MRVRAAAALVASVTFAFVGAVPASAVGPAEPAAPPQPGDGSPTVEPAAAEFTEFASLGADDEPWNGSFGSWAASPLTTDVNNEHAQVSITVSPDVTVQYHLSIYDADGNRVCLYRAAVPDACAFTSTPATDASETYTAYVARNAPVDRIPTEDVRAVSEPITITNTGWHGELIAFGPTLVTDEYQLIEARVNPKTAGGYLLSVYDTDGNRVCTSRAQFPDACGFTARPDESGLQYRAFVANTAPAVGFPLEPRLTSDVLVVLPPQDDFVYVALGDSYQSGEGAGNSIADTNAYLSTAYENGENYASQTGDQENTYVEQLSADGNRCHRALQNYAKINRDQLEPLASVVLVDETCSGAQIVRGGQPGIVGSIGGGVDPDSQIAQAIARLEAQGLSADDVDLVTVGMGGNDAGFGDIVQACVVPNLVRRVIALYPNPPAEIEFLANHVASCQNIDLFARAGKDIDGLQPKEEWAQLALLGAFSNARVMQLNYPDVLPNTAEVPAWCGGVSSTDVSLMRDRAARINGQISGAVAVTGSESLELVDVSGAFGANPLCPGAGGTVLANGFDDANVDREIERLLNVNGDGDPVARAQLDALMGKYGVWRACVANKANPFDGDCDLSVAWDGVPASVDDVIAYLETQKDLILGNLVEAPGPGAESVPVRYDRSRGLFHPTSAGQEAVACRVRAAYEGVPGAICSISFAPGYDTADGERISAAPRDTSAGSQMSFVVGGFAPSSEIRVAFQSEIYDLGTVTADVDGVVHADVEIPDAAPGVHRVTFTGSGLGGTQVVKEAKVTLAGEPAVDEIRGMYICGFEPEVPGDGVTEFVDVSVLGATIATVPDGNGCFFLEIPMPADTTDVTVEAVSRLTGETVTETVEVVNPDALQFGGWGHRVDGNGDWNDGKAGRAVPIKFQVLEADGSPMRDRSKIDLRSYVISCDDGSDAGDVSQADHAGWSSLRYHGNGWWMFDWKTSKSFEDTCRTFSVVIDHGGRHDALFSFDRQSTPPDNGDDDPKPGHDAVKNCWGAIVKFLVGWKWHW